MALALGAISLSRSSAACFARFRRSCQVVELRVWGVWGLGFGVWVLGFGACGLGFRLWGLSFEFGGLGFDV